MVATKSLGYIKPSKVEEFYSSTNFDRAGTGVEKVKMMQKFGMGAVMDAEATVPTSPFLQFIVPAVVRAQIAPLKAQKLLGVDMVGRSFDREIVYKTTQSKGYADAYTDFSNMPLSDFSIGFKTRDIVVLQAGLEVKWLEEQQYGAANINALQEKMTSLNFALNTAINEIGFRGVSGGRTYGILNDPDLLPYETAPKTWGTCTFAELQAQISLMATKVREQSFNIVEPTTDAMILAIPIVTRATLDINNSLNTKSVLGWIKETYPNWTIETVAQFSGANGGANVAYLYAETVVGDIGSTDNKAVFSLGMQAQNQVIGAGKVLSTFQSQSISATSGCAVKRAYAVTRWTGV